MKRTCSVQGCNRVHVGRGVCKYHYTQLRNTGSEITYTSAHELVRAQRGNPRSRPCIDCAQPARHWSYNNRASNELVSQTGARFSADPSDYEPRCAKCHHAFDSKHRAEQLRKAAEPLREQIMHAVNERKRARREGDRQAYALWDEELERLTASLERPDLARG